MGIVHSRVSVIVQKMTDQINRVARENLTGINVVHAFNAEQYQNDKFDESQPWHDGRPGERTRSSSPWSSRR